MRYALPRTARCWRSITCLQRPPLALPLGMGIHGLTSFIDSAFTGWQRERVQGHLVIDGSSLCHQLYSSDWTHGGQYPEFRETIAEFFQAVQKAEILPIVVFDGIDYKQEKTKVILKRRKEWIQYIHSKITSAKSRPAEALGLILPTLALEVFQLTILELNVPLYVVDGEADSKIVEIANFYSCPVLSLDSDFYIFAVQGGYIPVDRFHWKSTPLIAEVFHLEAFLDQFKLQDENLRYLIPVLVGNDFLPHLLSPAFAQHIGSSVSVSPNKSNHLLLILRYASKFDSLDDFLEQASSIPRGIDKSILRKSCLEAEQMYGSPNTQNPDEMMKVTELKSSAGNEIPGWLLHQFRTGRLPLYIMEALVLEKCLLRIVVENSQLPSSLTVSGPLRQYMYIILGLGKSSITETFRHGTDLQGVRVSCVPPEGLQLPEISNVLSLSLPVREQLFYSMLGCDPMVIAELEDSWKLVAASAMFWARSSHAPVYLVKALVLCFFFCFTCRGDLRRIRRESVVAVDYRKSPKWMAALHAFAQWQCVYFDAMTLNQLLMEPLKCISPAFLYDGKIAVHLASIKNMDRKVASSPIDPGLYEALLGSVLSQSSVMASTSKAENSRPKGKASQAVDKPEMKPKKTNSKFAHMNRFALLEGSDSDENSDSEESD